MRIGILGSGIVGQVLGRKLAVVGHDVMLGSRTPHDLDVRRGQGGTLRDWLRQIDSAARIASFEDAATHGEVVINATNGFGALHALQLAGTENLRGKILMDVSNPLDSSRGMPPTLSFCNTDSLGERIQSAFPDVRVVKTLNTINAHLMVDPGQLADGDHHIFVSGNDPRAKTLVIQYLKDWFGWKEVIDLGDITTSRGAEMLLPLWIRLWGTLHTPIFNIKVVR